MTANIEAKTLGEEQTPAHYAAKNDACGSLKLLVKEGCEYKHVRDSKGRTPLHLAAELGECNSFVTLVAICCLVHLLY